MNAPTNSFWNRFLSHSLVRLPVCFIAAKTFATDNFICTAVTFYHNFDTQSECASITHYPNVITVVKLSTIDSVFHLQLDDTLALKHTHTHARTHGISHHHAAHSNLHLKTTIKNLWWINFRVYKRKHAVVSEWECVCVCAKFKIIT